MENLTKTKMTLLASFFTFCTLFFIGCSDSGGGTESRNSTSACPSNPYYDQYKDEWYVSYNDLTICNPLPAAQNLNCSGGEVIVRSPFEYGNRFNNDFNNRNIDINNNNFNCNNPNCYNNASFNGGVNVNASVNINANINGNVSLDYHRYPNQYREVCMARGGAGWNYVVPAGGYFYVDYNRLYTNYNNNVVVTAGYVYYPTPLATLFTFGVLAALFLL